MSEPVLQNIDQVPLETVIDNPKEAQSMPENVEEAANAATIASSPAADKQMKETTTESTENLKNKMKTLESETTNNQTASTPAQSTKQHLSAAQVKEVESIKQQSEEVLVRAKGIIFEKTKIIKNQELQIEALTQQVESLKEVVAITKDLLDIRNMEVTHLKEKMDCMEDKMKVDKERQELMNTKLEKMVRMNIELKSEYEKQLALFIELKGCYETRMRHADNATENPTTSANDASNTDTNGSA